MPAAKGNQLVYMIQWSRGRLQAIPTIAQSTQHTTPKQKHIDKPNAVFAHRDTDNTANLATAEDQQPSARSEQ